MGHRARTAVALGSLLLLLGLNLADLVHHSDHGGFDDCAFCVCHHAVGAVPDAQVLPDAVGTRAPGLALLKLDWPRPALDAARGRAPPRPFA